MHILPTFVDILPCLELLGRGTLCLVFVYISAIARVIRAIVRALARISGPLVNALAQ